MDNQLLSQLAHVRLRPHDKYLRLIESSGLKWYRSSETARRGFCQECGSVLFWKGDGRDYTAIAAGSIDGPLGVPLEGHIFCDSAGDYYEIAGGQYCAARWANDPAAPE